MKRKPKKVENKKNAQSGNHYIYIIGIFVAIFVFLGCYCCVLYCDYVVTDIEPNANSVDPKKQLDFIYDVYHFVEDGLSPLILANEYVDKLVNLLNSSNLIVQEGATRTLLLLATHQDSMLINEKNAYSSLFQLIHSSNENVPTMVLKHLNIFIRQHPLLGTELLTIGLDKHLLKLVNSKPSNKILEITVLIMSDLFQSKYSLAFHQSLNELLPAFSKLLRHSDDEIITSSILALFSLTENSGMKIIFDNKMINTLITLLDHLDTKISNAALKILDHTVNNAFINGTNIKSQLILEYEMLHKMRNMLEGNRTNVVQVVISLIFQSVQTSPNKISDIFEANLIPLISDKLTDQSPLIRRRVAAILSIIINHGKTYHIATLLNLQIIPELYNVLLETSDDEIKRLILNAFKILIQHADQEIKMNIYDDFEKLDAFQEFSKLVIHRKRLIRNFAQSILDLFSSENLGISVCLKKSFFV